MPRFKSRDPVSPLGALALGLEDRTHLRLARGFDQEVSCAVRRHVFHRAERDLLGYHPEAVTRAPTQVWTAQQLRNATPFGQGPQFVLRHRDDKFGAPFDRVAKGAGARVVRTAVRAPLMNAVCERFLGSVRRLGHRHARARRTAP